MFPPSAEAMREPPASASAEEDFSGSGTLLIADDEPLVRNVARVLLESVGFDVVEAANGAEAVALYRKRAGEFRAVVLDVTMPGLGGVEALGLIREVNPQARVILSGGFDECDNIARLVRDARVEFLQKPYRAHTLLSKVRAVLERYDEESVSR